jgi:hypothetical protein
VLSVLVCLSTAITAQPAGAADERLEHQDYFLGDLFPDCWLFAGVAEPPTSPVPSNKGGACFRLRARDLSVTVKIEDDSGMPVSGTYQFESSSGAAGGYGNFCESFTRRVPESAAKIIIFVHGPSSGLLLYGPSSVQTCLDRGAPGWGTTGTITARFKVEPLR